MTFEPNKPFKTRNGCRACIVRHDGGEGKPFVGWYILGGYSFPLAWAIDGTCGDPRLSLVNEPEIIAIDAWFNVYEDHSISAGYRTRAEADLWWNVTKRIACIHPTINVRVGDGLCSETTSNKQ